MGYAFENGNLDKYSFSEEFDKGFELVASGNLNLDNPNPQYSRFGVI